MKTFYEPLKELNEYMEASLAIERGKYPVHLTGVIDTQKCHIISGLGQGTRNKVIITYDELKAKEIYEDYRLFDRNVYLYPAKDVIFYSADIHGNAIVKERLKIIQRLLEQEDTTVVMTISAGMDKILPMSYLADKKIVLQEGMTVDFETMKKELVRIGYERTGQVERAGEYAIRGGILDIFPLTEECPYRIELWDDEIDTIRSFDRESQRSIESVASLTVYPAAEILLNEDVIAQGLKRIEKDRKKAEAKLKKEEKLEELRRLKSTIEEFEDTLDIYSSAGSVESYINYFFEDTVSFFEYFESEDTLFFVDEPARVSEQGEAVEFEFRESMMSRLEKGYILPGQAEVLYSYRALLAALEKKRTILLSTMDYAPKPFKPMVKYDFTVKSVNSYQNDFEILVKDIKRWRDKNYRILLLSGSGTRAVRLCDNLREYELDVFYSEDFDKPLQSKQIMTAYGKIRRGFEYPMIRFVVISESDIFTQEKRKRKKKKTAYEGTKVHNFAELNIGDYVIHENHGMGVYKGIEKVEVDQVTKDYVKIEYAGGSNLYVLATGLDVLQKYGSADGKRPKLNKLNSLEWKKTKTKVRGAVEEVARDLVELYAKRQNMTGYRFGEDTVWQKEFEETFPYDETDDQLTAIEATKKDMESNKIMDRLVCGDVGYGKTEIAIRAAFKAVMDGKQVAFLVPTTILAQQHYNTFLQRMKDFPVNIDMLSRFRTPAQQKKAIELLRKGQLDIIIGTHRLLSKDIEFKDLGLLIVDEEQRFGVTHKEKIKKMKGDVDVLTLSATPIPRTLHMSLIGIRDMSVLEEPPVDRVPIQTYVLEQNDEIVREAINRELARGGQIYYVHNRVSTVDAVAANVSRLVPDAVVAYAHGQMKERELERIMFDFINGNIDVLVATTIIETGLDISNVNTMIIDDADRLGLSQLYQLRGRVGRSNRTAYAFLMYKRDKMLKEVAEKRLQAIREFTDLGSGFKIAMRDLEIRGAGNLLGERQHGHMEAVGYDLYCKMLNEAVKELKGEDTSRDEYETSVDMDIDAYIPASYIKSEYQKLDMYKRIATIENEEEYMDMQEELTDRFGDMPKAVENLLNIALVKAMAHDVYMTQILHKGSKIKLVLFARAKLDVAAIPALVESYHGQVQFVVNAEPYFIYELKEKNKPFKLDIADMFQRLKEFIKQVKKLVDAYEKK